jgi:hypothetical protein
MTIELGPSRVSETSDQSLGDLAVDDRERAVCGLVGVHINQDPDRTRLA